MLTEGELGGSTSPYNHTHTEGGVQVLVRSREDTPPADTHTHGGWGPGAEEELGGTLPCPNTEGMGSRC